jgi:hypothetical protein
MAGYCHNYVSFRKARVVMIKPKQAAPMGKKYRVSSESAWPVRNSEGLTFAEAKRRREQEQSK